MNGRNRYGSRLPVVLGIMFWLGLSGWIVLVSTRADHSEGAGRIASKVTDYLLLSDTELTLRTGTLFVSETDPVFVQRKTGDWEQVGHIARTDGESAKVSWYADRQPRHYRFRYYRNQGTLEEAVTTLLPPEKRAIIQDKIAATTRAHRRELGQAFEPVVTSLLEKSAPVIVDGVSQALRRHRDAFAKIAARYETNVLERRLMPLAESELLPAIREHGGPVAKKIGYELWERASLWRFGWRMAHDKLPLTSRKLVEEEWTRFVREEAVPVFEEHTDSLLNAVKHVVQEVAASDRVRREAGEVARTMLADDELKQLLGEMFEEAVVKNQRLHRIWLEAWHSEEAQAALELTMKRLEPLIAEIGDEILGSRESGITPEFARVLRRQILGKDRRWIVAERRNEPLPDGSTPPLRHGQDTAAFPLVHLAYGAGSEMLEVSR